MNSRRKFLFKLAISASTPGILCRLSSAQTPPPPPPPPVKLEESDPVAKALGYTSDTNLVDAKKYPQHTKDQKCSGCSLFQEKANQPMSPCATFGGKLVPPAAWCVAFAKKPAAAK